MRYIDCINNLLQKETAASEGLVIFGQNVAAGSHISGMTKALSVGRGGRILNTTNSENTLANIGFGLMLGGVSSIFFMKQQDFLLLGIDPLVNTYNFIRRRQQLASYTIFFIVVDSGYQGLQSSMNGFGDICSIARVPGFTIQAKADAEAIIGAHLITPGFRIIGISQRLMQQEIIDREALYINESKSLFQYSKGDRATIACFNFSLPYGLKLEQQLLQNGISASLFGVNAVTPIDWTPIVADALHTGRLIIIDDCKSENRSSDSLSVATYHGGQCRIEFISRSFAGDWLSPQKDELVIDYDSIVALIAQHQTV